MKKTILILTILFTVSLSAQNYNPIINYHFNGTPKSGIKINTNIPFADGTHMPTIIIEGFEYSSGSTIGLTLNWYVFKGAFTRHSVSSHGSYTPEIKLYNEEGKVIIFINDRKYFNRFTIRGYANGVKEVESYFQNWTITDNLPTVTKETKETIVPYKNTFAGNITFPNGIWNENGDVGIGTIPSGKLTIKKASESSNGLGSLSLNGDGSANLRLGVNNDYSWIQSHGLKPLYINELGNDLILNKNKGNVGIGTTDTFDYKLAVNGTISAKKVKVEISSAWPDYVFTKEYELPTLKEVEKHIAKKGHLKNIPSAKEVANNGIELGNMNKQLLQKIEELTLYTIQQQKEIEAEKEKNSNLEERIKKIEALIQQ